MTNLEALAGRLHDARQHLTAAQEAVAVLLAMPEDDQPLTPRQSAKLLLRADKLADALERLADELALLVPETSPEPPSGQNGLRAVGADIACPGASGRAC